MSRQAQDVIQIIVIAVVLGLLITLPPWERWIHKAAEIAAWNMGYRR